MESKLNRDDLIYKSNYSKTYFSKTESFFPTTFSKLNTVTGYFQEYFKKCFISSSLEIRGVLRPPATI